MAENKVDNIMIDGARIWARNFAGKEGRFNAAGDRNFNVWLEPDLAEKLKADGWNVKYYIPKSDPDADPRPFLKVAVSYRFFPPKVYRVSSDNKRILLDEDNVGTLDWEEINKVRLIIRPYSWEVNGRTGIKAYVKTLYAEVEEDPFEKQYAEKNGELFPDMLGATDEEVPF